MQIGSPRDYDRDSAVVTWILSEGAGAVVWWRTSGWRSVIAMRVKKRKVKGGRSTSTRRCRSRQMPPKMPVVGTEQIIMTLCLPLPWFTTASEILGRLMRLPVLVFGELLQVQVLTG